MSRLAGGRGINRCLWWLTLAAVIAGILSTLSYGSGAHIAVRFFSPSFGAWWNAHEYRIMESCACALGLLGAIRSGARLTEAGESGRRAKLVSLVAAVIIAAPLASAIASLARMGWDGAGAPIRGFLIAIAGYEAGTILDKILIAGVYFLKSAGFALLAGFALYALVVVISMASERSETIAEPQEVSPR